MIQPDPKFKSRRLSLARLGGVLIMKTILAFASVLAALSAQAYAADLAEPAPVPEVVEPVATGGWYLRKDISYDFVNFRGGDYKVLDGRTDIDGEVDDTGNLGFGVGYQVNDYFRVDKTFDYMFSSSFRGSTKGGKSDFGACDVKCTSTDASSFKAYSLMANAYVDIYHWGVFTPYAGVGLGTTYINWGDLKNTACPTDGGRCDDQVTHKGKDSWRFTYALMAGTSIDINCQWKADVGYRYRHVNGGSMFGYKADAGPGKDKGFDIHEVRSGIRYQFGDACPVAYMPPAELPAEQPVFK
jgi:opacity protein-like surface antigen